MSVFRNLVWEFPVVGTSNITQGAGFCATLHQHMNPARAGLATQGKWQSPARKASKTRPLGWVQPTYHRPARGLFVSRHAPRSPPA